VQSRRLAKSFEGLNSSPVTKICVLVKSFDTNIDQYFEDFKEDAQQRYATIALWVHQCLSWFRDRNY